MSAGNHDSYLESKILTAPSYRLHLMLVEAALRFGRQAAAAGERDDWPAADVPLLRMLDILGELLAGARQQNTALSQQVGEVYLYLFRTAAAAKVNADRAKLDEVLALLEYERQTWQMVCEKLGGAADCSQRPPAAGPRQPSPNRPHSGGADRAAASRLSLEA